MAERRVVALSMGVSRITAVQGVVSGEPEQRVARVEKIVTVSTPPGSIRTNGIHDPAALSAVLSKMWADNKFATKDVIAAFTSTRVVSGIKWIPAMHPDDLERAVTHEWVNSQTDLPSVDPAHMTLHHFVLKRRTVTLSGQSRVEVLLMIIGTPKAEAQAIANVIEDAGLELVGLDLNALALMRGARLMATESMRELELLVDVGDVHVTMVLHANGNLRAIETLSTGGGSSVTTAIANVLRPVVEKGNVESYAEEIKRSLAASSRGQDIARDALVDRALMAVKEQTASISREIARFVTDYLNTVNSTVDEHGETIRFQEDLGLKSISLTGGGSALHGLVDQLRAPVSEGGLGASVYLATPAPNFTWADESKEVASLASSAFYGGYSIVTALGVLTAKRMEEQA